MGKVLKSKYRTMKLRKNKVSDSNLNVTLDGSILSYKESDGQSGVVTPSRKPSAVTPSRGHPYTTPARNGHITPIRRFFSDIFTPTSSSQSQSLKRNAKKAMKVHTPRNVETPGKLRMPSSFSPDECDAFMDDPLYPHTHTSTISSRKSNYSNASHFCTSKKYCTPKQSCTPRNLCIPSNSHTPRRSLTPKSSWTYTPGRGYACTPSHGVGVMYTPKAVAPVMAPWIYCSTPRGLEEQSVEVQMWNFLAQCDPHGEVWSAIINILKRMEGTCLELALEGERLCKAGDCRTGVQFFEAAVQVGTDDLKTLGAIYSQLGNAYFYLQEYGKALEYHKHDLNLTRTIGDRLGEAKASGNLGNTLKVLGKYEEAIVCCQRHLDISRELNDRIGEARALYNLGNVYHARGKHMGRSTKQDPGEFPQEVKDALLKAAKYYEENLVIVRELGDRAAQGRACGNLGNTHYLLANFSQAIKYHEERLAIAKEFGDKSAERRAYSNLGNTHIFLGQFDTAAEHYRKTLQIARQLVDRALEAQACYSLGNTYTLLRDFERAIEYHLLHLVIAQELGDKIGEGRACWSLGNAHTALQHHEEALQFASRHLRISKEIGDQTGQLTAQMNLAELKEHLGITSDSPIDELGSSQEGGDGLDVDAGVKRPPRMRRSSMEQMEVIRLTPDKREKNGVRPKPPKVQKAASIAVDLPERMLKDKSAERPSSTPATRPKMSDSEMLEEDNFFDLLSRFQSRRIDDQRCSVRVLEKGDDKSSTSSSQNGENKENTQPKATTTSAQDIEFLDMVAGIQGSRMNDQRADLPEFPGLHNQQEVIGQYMTNRREENALDDQFFEMLMRCQGSRIDDQRTSLPDQPVAPTVPDEDFLSLIQRAQSDRLDEQRTKMPKKKGQAAQSSSRRGFGSSSNPLKKSSKKDKKHDKS